MSRTAVIVVVVLLVGGSTAGVLAYDGDGDGVSTPAELTGPTDPFEADTDGDGLDDGREASLGSDPVATDTDDDGLADRDEVVAHGTDPTRSDGDSDGVSDRAEVNDHPTDPVSADTDGDGLDDGAELFDLGTDPLAPDTDGDSVADGTERQRASSPTDRDTDDDALHDGEEYDRGTDPRAEDTDSDGFTDGVEVHAGSILPDADPARKDVYLEIDYMRGTQIPEGKLKRVQRAFATAPVKNPDGSRGITLHIRTSDSPVPPESETSLASYQASYYRSAYDTRGYGYFHVLVVRDVTDRGAAARQVGLTWSGINGMLVEDRPSRVRVAKTVMHELGHKLGLYPNDHPGIDSYDLEPKQYPSVMNYHRLGPCDCNYDYSDGSHGPNDFDDWGHIAATLAERTPNASAAQSHI